MTLQNLLAIHRLQEFGPERSGVLKLLQAAERNLADAQIEALSADNRFDVAYKTIMQCVMLGLWANGYRTSTSQSGHHLTAIQSLPLTMQIPADTVIVLDALRKQRNINDYEGDPIADSALATCIAAQMEARAGNKGITYVAFTATPKAKTLELFGRRPNPAQPASADNLPEPFHVLHAAGD